MTEELPPSATTGKPAFASFRIVVQLEAKHITPARRVIADIARSIGLRDEVAARLALAAHELLENAVKYTLDEQRQVLLRLSIVTGNKARVTVSNVSSPAIFRRMHRRLHELNRCRDIGALYQTLIEKSVARNRGSGLGLARIRAEADMKLYCTFRGDMLSVRAEVMTGALL